MGPYITDKSAIVGYHTHEISLKSIKIHQHPLKSHENSITLVSLGLNLPFGGWWYGGPFSAGSGVRVLAARSDDIGEEGRGPEPEIAGGVDDHGLTMV